MCQRRRGSRGLSPSRRRRTPLRRLDRRLFTALTDWLSMTPGFGLASCHSRSCKTMWSSLQMASKVPSSWNLQKMLWTVGRGGGLAPGRQRHGHPVQSRKKIAFIAARMSVLRGRPPGEAGGDQRSRPFQLRIPPFACKALALPSMGCSLLRRPDQKIIVPKAWEQMRCARQPVLRLCRATLCQQ